MNNERFEALLPIFITDFIQKMAEQKEISDAEAISLFYNSRLYNYLEDEQTKTWHYSTERLLQLFEEEMNTGKLTLTGY